MVNKWWFYGDKLPFMLNNGGFLWFYGLKNGGFTMKHDEFHGGFDMSKLIFNMP